MTVLSAFYRLVRIGCSVSPGLLAILIAAAAVQGIIPAIQVQITKRLVDMVAQTFVAGPSYLGSAFILLGWQLVMAIATTAVSAADRVTSLRLENLISLEVESMVSRKAMSLPLEFFDTPDSYDQLQRAAAGHGSRGLDLVRSVITIGQRIITLVSLIFVIASFHWALAIGVAVAVIPTFLVNRKTGEMRFDQMRQQTPKVRMASYLSQLLRVKDAAKEIRLFNIGEYLLGRWKSIFMQISDENLTLGRRTASVQSVAELVSVSTGAILTGGLIWLGAYSQVTLGLYVALTQAVTSAQSQMVGLALTVAKLYENALFVTTLADFVDLPEAGQSRGQGHFPQPLTKGITVSGLGFSYPNSRRPALQDISFTIAAGERVAIVGENGAGKSTLVKCLLGLYTPTAGIIQFDDSDLTVIDPADLRANMSAIFQDHVRYYLSLKENIVLGQLERADDIEAMLAAAEKGGAAEVVSGLPEGYETVLGSAFTGGQELSYGQWQKVALSRTLFREAQVLFLDEPTASVDPASEAAVFERFYNLTVGKTAFLISHRLGSCKIADRILVLKSGRLVESGTHEQLMARNGEYAKMVRIQAHWSPEPV